MDFNRNMRFPTMWYVPPAKAQTSLRNRTVWSEPLLAAWIFYDPKATGRTSFGVSKLKGMLHRLVWVYACKTTTLLEITCRGSYYPLSTNTILKAVLQDTDYTYLNQEEPIVPTENQDQSNFRKRPSGYVRLSNSTDWPDVFWRLISVNPLWILAYLASAKGC